MARLIKHWHRRVVSILGAIALFGNVCAVVAGETVVVLKSRDAVQYDQAVSGVIQGLKGHGSDIQIQQFTLTSASDDLRKMVGSDETPSVIVCVGTEATRWAIKNTRVPVVYCMVANAQQSVMADLTETTKGRVRGVSLDIPAQTQLRRMLDVLPKVKRVGVLSDPKKSAAAVAEMKQAAAELGLEVVSQEVDGPASLPEAAASIASRIDLLWAPVDSTVFNSRSAQFVLTQMLQHKVPVMGFSENMVKAGALLAPRVSYEAVGRQTAELVRAALNPDGKSPESVQAPRDFEIVVNGRVLELLGNPIPQAAIHQVSVINNED